MKYCKRWFSHYHFFLQKQWYYPAREFKAHFMTVNDYVPISVIKQHCFILHMQLVPIVNFKPLCTMKEQFKLKFGVTPSLGINSYRTMVNETGKYCSCFFMFILILWVLCLGLLKKRKTILVCHFISMRIAALRLSQQDRQTYICILTVLLFNLRCFQSESYIRLLT